MNIDDTYTAKAKEIIKNSIKTAIYIDEKAWAPFASEIFEPSIEEHVISKDLFENFKQEGINLCIHKFNQGDESLGLTSSLKKYLFEGIDIILLDWDLDNDKSNKPALKLLSDIIEQPNIHFCSIYSSSPNFDDIIKKLCSYFSGISSAQYQEIRLLIEPYEEAAELLKEVDITSRIDSQLIHKLNKVDANILKKVSEITHKNFNATLADLAISINDNLTKSDTPFNYYKEIISRNGPEYTLLINNTIITIQRKVNNKPDEFILKFSDLITRDREKSYFKILGLDMQNEFSRKSAFINPEVLNINLNSFLFHRRKILEKYNNEQFESHIKDILLKNAEITFNDSKLSFLDSTFLDSIDNNANAENEQIALINTFYNGAFILKENRLLNFGDIFVSDGSYYLCITALCDCQTHYKDDKEESNIDFKYFFVKGSKLSNIIDGISKGDGSFISYIDGDTCIGWTNGQYIKPFQLFIPNPHIIEGRIIAYDWDRKPQNFELDYKFTLKLNYAQRIANYAFAHPIRVGVDFVKI